MCQSSLVVAAGEYESSSLGPAAMMSFCRIRGPRFQVLATTLLLFHSLQIPSISTQDSPCTISPYLLSQLLSNPNRPFPNPRMNS